MLDAKAKELAQGPNIATLATLLPDGRPITHVVWVDVEGDRLVVNTEVERQKFKNVRRDPRVSLTIIDSADPYRYAEVRGRVVETVDGIEAREHIDRLSEKYTGGPYKNPIGSDRVILRIEPERVHSQV
jgi:PPOX class probable F420-dependent enzyme